MSCVDLAARPFFVPCCDNITGGDYGQAPPLPYRQGPREALP